MISKGSASTQGSTGKEVALRTAVIPNLTLGGAVVSNVVVLVSKDKSFKVNLGKHSHFQIQGVLGYPVLAALGSLTITPDALEVRPASEPSPRSARLYVDEFTPLMAATIEGHELLFQLDTGADAASFTLNYLREFPGQFASMTPKQWGTGGIGGVRFMPAYTLPQVDIHLGSAVATLKNVPVMTEPLGLDPLDALFGNLGQGLLQKFVNYTIDLNRMQLVLGPNASE